MPSGKPCIYTFNRSAVVSRQMARRSFNLVTALLQFILLSLLFPQLAASLILWAFGLHNIFMYHRPLASRHSLTAPVSHPYAFSYT
jgi:hypothetical protein